MKRFLHNRTGATSIEYAMIASLIGFLLIGALTSIGGSLDEGFAAVLEGFS